jgi:hypothetical protein
MALAPAVELARKYLADLEPRWSHVRAVGAVTEELCRDHGLTEELAAAAWLHDIGYSPALSETGFHPLDGARFLQRISASDIVVSLVAHHSGARFEAEERGRLDELNVIPEPPRDLLDVLVLVDMTTSPTARLLRVGRSRHRGGLTGSDLSETVSPALGDRPHEEPRAGPGRFPRNAAFRGGHTVNFPRRETS